MRVIYRILLVGALTASLFSLPLQAQFSSILEGTVTDTSGASVPEADVQLTNMDSGVAQKSATNSAGLFRIPALPSGHYKLTVSKTGFKTAIQQNIILEAARTQTVPVTLELGEVSSTVSVNDTPPTVELTEARVSGYISSTQVQELPLVGRNVFSTVALTPGVTGTGTTGSDPTSSDYFNTTSFVAISANGGRGSSNLFLIDDTSTEDYPSSGGSKLSPNPDSVQEVRVSVNNYSAEYGRSSSVVTQVITKSGSNNFHGTLNWFHQDNVLTARNFLQNTINPATGRVVPVSRRNEFGGSVGGPVREDSTFFFFSYSKLLSQTSTASTVLVETPQFVDFMRTHYPNNVSTTLLQQFPTATSGIAPGSTKTVADLSPGCIGTGPLGMPCNLPLTGSSVFSASVPRNGQQWNLRIDQNFPSGKDRIYGNFYRTTLLPYGNDPRPEWSFPTPQYTNYIGLNWTHVFSPNIVNVAAGGATNNHADFWSDCRGCHVPAITVVGLEGFGNGFGPGTFTQNDFHWRDMLSMNRGKHALRAGFDIFRDQDFAPFSAPIQRPSYFFLSVLDFAADKPFNESGINFDPRTGQRANLDRYYFSSIYGLYLQDDWKVRRNLTLNLGLRWDFTSNPYEKYGQMTNYRLGDGPTMMDRIAGLSVVQVNSLLHTHRIGYFAPRFGFAWDPLGNGKTSVRGGFGIFYDRGGNTFWSDTQRSNPPLVASITAFATSPPGQQPVFGLCQSDQFPFNCQAPPPVVGLNPRNGPIAGLASVGGTDPGLKYAYAENWFFGIQRSFGSHWTVEADYLGSLGRHLYMIIDRNRYAGDRVLHNGDITRLNPYFATINYADNSGNSWYHGGTLAVRKSFDKGLTFEAAYTRGKAIDYTNAALTANKQEYYAPVLDAWNIARQRGLSENDFPNKLTFNYVWEIPGTKFRNALLTGLVNGWQLSSLTILQSGRPYTVYTGSADYNGDGNFYDVPNAPSIDFAHQSHSRSDYINGIFAAANFPSPCPTSAPCGVEGNLGRNTYRGPGFAQMDLGLVKNNHIPWFVSERADLQIRADFYNALNRVNLSSWDTNLDSNTFGKSTSSFAPRTIQLGVRILF